MLTNMQIYQNSNLLICNLTKIEEEETKIDVDTFN